MAKRFIPLKFKNYDQDGNELEPTILMFRLGPKAVNLFQTVSGVAFNQEELENLGIKGIVYLLYAGCKDMKHDLTIEQMWDLVDNFELEELGELMNKIFPQVEGETDPNGQM